VWPKGQILKMPAIQNGKRESFSDFADEIWLMNEDDLEKIDILDKNGGFIFPVFRSGGVLVRHNRQMIKSISNFGI
jgi:hypothetical protein